MRYRVDTPLRRNGEFHPAGSVVDLPEDEATPLLACGAIVGPIEIIPPNNPRESEEVPVGSPPPPEAQETPAAKGGAKSRRKRS